MVYDQTPRTESNNALYFIVGGLLVLALVIGAFVLNSNRAENAYEPAAGMAETSAPVMGDTPADASATTPSPDTATDTQAPLAP